MITLCLLGVIAILTAMLIIEGNATDNAEKRADLMTDLYDKSSVNFRRLQGKLLVVEKELKESNYMLEKFTEVATIVPSIDSKKAKKPPKKKFAGRQAKT